MISSKNEVPLTFCCTLLHSLLKIGKIDRERRPCSKDVISLKPLASHRGSTVILVGLI